MRRRRRLRVVDRVGVGLDRSAARGVDECDKAGDAEVYDLAGQGRERRYLYYVLDNLRNLAQFDGSLAAAMMSASGIAPAILAKATMACSSRAMRA